MDFDWDEGNIDHILLHDVTPEEAVDVFYDTIEESAAYLEENEWRKDRYGFANEGTRLLKVVWTQRGELIRVCTAYEPGAQDRKRLLKKVRR